MSAVPIEFLASLNVILFAIVIFFVKTLISKIEKNGVKLNGVDVTLAKILTTENHRDLRVQAIEKQIIKIEELSYELQRCENRLTSIEVAIAKH